MRWLGLTAASLPAALTSASGLRSMPVQRRRGLPLTACARRRAHWQRAWSRLQLLQP